MNDTQKLKILLADDHLVVRMGLATLLSFEDDMVIVGEASDGTEAVELARKLRPDVIIMDVMMPVRNGAEATETIVRESPEAKILLLTTYSGAVEVQNAVDAGALSALVKGCSREELVDAIHRTAAGESVFSDIIRTNLRSVPLPVKLTPRRLEVLGYVAKGLTNEQIAALLGIGANGVKNHLRAIFLALGVATRAEAVAIALREQLLEM